MTAHSSLVAMWKAINWNIPQFLAELITIEPNLEVTTSVPRLQIVGNSFRWESVRLWNLLPSHLRLETRISKFKSGVKLWLIEDGMLAGMEDDVCDNSIDNG